MSGSTISESMAQLRSVSGPGRAVMDPGRGTQRWEMARGRSWMWWWMRWMGSGRWWRGSRGRFLRSASRPAHCLAHPGHIYGENCGLTGPWARPWRPNVLMPERGDPAPIARVVGKPVRDLVVRPGSPRHSTARFDDIRRAGARAHTHHDGDVPVPVWPPPLEQSGCAYGGGRLL